MSIGVFSSNKVGSSSDVIIEATFVKFSTDFSASLTTAVLWTPVSGKKFVLCDWICASSSGGSIALCDSSDTFSNRIVKLYLSANGGAMKSYRKPFVSISTNNSLVISTGTGMLGSLTVSGYEI